MKFHYKLWQKLHDIWVKIGILQETPFSITEHQIEKRIY